ncbi:MAG: ABC transporter ATP-binding protein, partial [Dehalococcoidia bacterium]
MTAASTLLEVEGAHVVTAGLTLLRDASLTVARGEVVGVIGPNGAGKTTLLRVATGVRRPDRGRVLLDGQPLDARSRRDRAREIAVVEQLPEAPPTMLVGELVLLGRFPHLGLLGRESAHDRTAAIAAMERAGCLELASRPLHTLSGGERRRVFIARALAQEPRLLLLDEPASGLDAGAQGEVFEVLRTLAAEGAGVLVVVHDLTLAAATCDRLLLLHHGEQVAMGAPREVVTPAHVAAVYGPHVSVIAHPETGAPLVVPASTGAASAGAVTAL